MTSVLNHIKDYIILIRVRQWYKNLFIFLAIFFSGTILNRAMLLLTLKGFIALCLISSANYVFNDMIDLKNDKHHSEKRHRPLASGRIHMIEALMLFIVLVISSGVIAYGLGAWFFASVASLFILTTMYSLFLKDEPIVDILIIAVNFVIRTVSGAFIIEVWISPWLILCPFFIAIFLAVGKREADIKFLKEKAFMHKDVLRFYTKEITDSMMIIATTCLIMAYSLYAFSKTSIMLVTIPFAVYAVFRYYALASTGSEIARSPDKIYKDWRMMVTIILWGIALILIRYIFWGT